MTEWTSLSVTEEQRDQIKAEKPEGMPMGEFLVDAIVEGEVSIQQVDVGEIVDELRNELSMASDPTVSPDVDGMMERIDEVVREVKRYQEIEAELEEFREEWHEEIKKTQEIAEQARDNTDTITEGMR